MAVGLFAAFCVLLIAFFPVMRTFLAHDPLEYIYPNFLMFTSHREELKSAWKESLHINTDVKVHHTHIPEIQGDKFSYDALRYATDNFRFPAVVRGFFKDAPAIQKWKEEGYLSSRLGDFTIPVVNKAKYGTAQNDRDLMKFSEAFGEIMNKADSEKYIFFPVKSRKGYKGYDEGSSERLAVTLNDIIREDLQLDRIWHGFGGPNHANYYGGQIIIGRGSNSSDTTTGTGWHCAPGNNWFAQVVGSKRWYFMDQKNSAYMSPLKGGLANMMTGNREMASLHDHIPLRYVDIQAGDMLYNPDWEWHTIKNYEGVSIGCPIREINMTTSFRNNFQYSSILMMSKAADYFGFDMGGFHQG